MGGSKSKGPSLKACIKCGQISPVGNTFKDMCQSCVELKIERDRAEIQRNKDKNEVEREKLLADLEKRKREAELELKERDVRLEKEKRGNEITAKKAEQMALLELKKEKLKTDHEQALREDKEKHLEIKRSLDAEMNKLKVDEERVRLECEKNLKDVELDGTKRLAEMKTEHERSEKKQALMHTHEIHTLNMEMKKNSQEHDQTIKKRKVEMEAKFSERVGATFMINKSSGETAKLSIANDINPKLAAVLLASIGTQESIQAPGWTEEPVQGQNERQSVSP